MEWRGILALFFFLFSCLQTVRSDAESITEQFDVRPGGESHKAEKALVSKSLYGMHCPTYSDLCWYVSNWTVYFILVACAAASALAYVDAAWAWPLEWGWYFMLLKNLNLDTANFLTFYILYYYYHPTTQRRNEYVAKIKGKSNCNKTKSKK